MLFLRITLLLLLSIYIISVAAWTRIFVNKLNKVSFQRRMHIVRCCGLRSCKQPRMRHPRIRSTTLLSTAQTTAETVEEGYDYYVDDTKTSTVITSLSTIRKTTLKPTTTSKIVVSSTNTETKASNLNSVLPTTITVSVLSVVLTTPASTTTTPIATTPTTITVTTTTTVATTTTTVATTTTTVATTTTTVATTTTTVATTTTTRSMPYCVSPTCTIDSTRVLADGSVKVPMTQGFAVPICGSYFFFSLVPKMHKDAELECCKLGLKLVYLESLEEAVCLANLNKNFLGDVAESWSSASDDGAEGVWTWCPKNTLVSSAIIPWGQQQPSDVGKNENCGMVRMTIDSPMSITLNDEPCNSVFKFVCKK